MSKGGIKWSGVKELKAVLKKNASLDDVKKIVAIDGVELLKRAKKKAPYRTGYLRLSIMYEISDNGLTVTVTPHAPYASYVEYGTRTMDAQPYMRPAFNEASALFKAHMDKLIKR